MTARYIAAFLGVLTGWFWPFRRPRTCQYCGSGLAPIAAACRSCNQPEASLTGGASWVTCSYCSEWAQAGDRSKITEECFDPLREGHPHVWTKPPAPSFYDVEEF